MKCENDIQLQENIFDRHHIKSRNFCLFYFSVRILYIIFCFELNVLN